MTRWCALLLSILAPLFTVAAASPLLPLRVSENHRFLVQGDQQQPFFYLADTGWEIFHRLNREQADAYLQNRAGKGFNVIQAMVLAEFGGLTKPNPYGHVPLQSNDPTQPVEEYFQHVDWVVNRAASLGLYVAMVATWGDKVNQKWGQGPEIFTPENARVYGEFLGRRYRQAHVIWLLGGDRPIENKRHRLVYRALAEGLRAGDGGAHLMTYHPNGGRSSSNFVHEEPWLQFHMLQSGHGGLNRPSWGMLAKDYALTPTRPVLDGEPNYEDHPVRGKEAPGRWFDEWDVRKSSYWSVFAGGCGITYGAHPIWQFWDGVEKPCADPRHSWMDALDLLGSRQVGYLKRLMLSRPYLTRVPDQALLSSPAGEGAEHLQATRDEKGTYAMVYSPQGQPFTVDLTKLSSPQLKAWWWDPRTGVARLAEAFTATPTREFQPPRSGEGMDWVLVVDDATKSYPVPGESPVEQ